MARPQKPRVVTENAPSTYFKPQGIPMYELTEIVLTLDGVEALRLVDVDGHDQVEAARQMGVSRSTLSRILAQARQVTATAVTRGLALRIEGGSVSGPANDGCGHRPRARFGDEAATDDPVGE